MTDTWTREQLFDYVAKEYGDQAIDARNMIVKWLDRGDGAAIYTNHDLGSRDVGMPKIVSYGSPAAQLEVESPPQTLPDGIPAGAINWRYQLYAVCGGPAS